ncbi:MAG: S8 family serine peptidase [Rhodothermales bacterium]|nr:S8 family serine peptidase [Rhodothermales bacterium]
MTFRIVLLSLLLSAFSISSLDDKVRLETRVDRVHRELGMTGEGVIVAILDRGIDYEHPDFRNEDGTTRILFIYDMTDDTGAGASDNSFGLGTIYTRAQINAALTSGIRLATRDAFGHGTTTAGLAAGNGRASDGLYAGMAPDADLIVVKIVGGAPAHGNEPAEESADVRDMEAAMDFVIQKAEEAGQPFVALANIGSIGAASDGTTAWARAIDERFGDDFPGRVFVTGTSDDGGMPNHAAGLIQAGQSADLLIHKGDAGNLRFEMWYPGSDRYDVTIIGPGGTFGPYAYPVNANRDTQQTVDFTYFHNGTAVDFWDAASSRREILIDFATSGDYTVRLERKLGIDGRFDAFLNPSRLFEGVNNRFESFVVPGYTVWDMASSQTNIAPNSYVLRHDWTDIDGVARSESDEGAIGDLWLGSGIGPTMDDRRGVTVSAPGERLFAPYAPRSFYATDRANIVRDDGAGGMYGLQSAVSAAAPVTTGIIALMLQANPQLGAVDVRVALQQTAREDAFTGDTPNSRWGFGKIDAFAAVARILGVVDLVEVEGALPREATLFANYPNPFSGSTTLRFALPAPADVRLSVFDMLGRDVTVLVDQSLSAGVYETAFHAEALPAGVYVVRLEAGGRVFSRTLTHIR